MLNHNLLCYSSNSLMNKPSKKYVEEWKLTQEKIGLLEEIMEDVKKYKKEDVWYLVRNDEYRVLGSFYTLNEAISFAEKKKKENGSISSIKLDFSKSVIIIFDFET